jgi:hypothetical protein
MLAAAYWTTGVMVTYVATLSSVFTLWLLLFVNSLTLRRAQAAKDIGWQELDPAPPPSGILQRFRDWANRNRWEIAGMGALFAVIPIATTFSGGGPSG